MIKKSLISLIVASSLLAGCVSMGNREVEDKRVSTAFITCSNEDVLRDCRYTSNATNSKFSTIFQEYILANEDRKNEIRLLVESEFTGGIKDEIYKTLDISDTHLGQYLQMESFRIKYDNLFPDTNRTTSSTDSSPDDTQKSYY